MKSVHEESKQLYPCDFCGLSYKTKLKMEKHTKTAHDVKMAYQCEICLVGFKHNAKLKSMSRKFIVIKKSVIKME